MKAKIQTMTRKITTQMTSNNMKECMHQNIVNEAEEYASIHKNINENEPDDPNDTKLDENTVAYVSDTRVSKE